MPTIHEETPGEGIEPWMTSEADLAHLLGLSAAQNFEALPASASADNLPALGASDGLGLEQWSLPEPTAPSYGGLDEPDYSRFENVSCFSIMLMHRANLKFYSGYPNS